MKKPVKVNPFDPIEPGITMETYDDGTVKRKSLGVPVRLMLASQLLSGFVSSSLKDTQVDPREVIRAALNAADLLINAHNEDVEKL